MLKTPISRVSEFERDFPEFVGSRIWSRFSQHLFEQSTVYVYDAHQVVQNISLNGESRREILTIGFMS